MTRLTEDRRQLPLRIAVLRYLVATCFVAIGAAFWYLQVAQHQRFEEMAQNNHMRTLSLRAPRGTLFDRNGRVLVENRYAFDVSLVREQTTNLDRTLQLVASITGTPESSLREIVVRHAREPRDG